MGCQLLSENYPTTIDFHPSNDIPLSVSGLSTSTLVTVGAGCGKGANIAISQDTEAFELGLKCPTPSPYHCAPTSTAV